MIKRFKYYSSDSLINESVNTDFKVGDKVKVVKIIEENSLRRLRYEKEYLNKIGTIIRITNDNYPYAVNFGNDVNQYFISKELEFVGDIEETNFEEWVEESKGLTIDDIKIGGRYIYATKTETYPLKVREILNGRTFSVKRYYDDDVVISNSDWLPPFTDEEKWVMLNSGYINYPWKGNWMVKLKEMELINDEEESNYEEWDEV